MTSAWADNAGSLGVTRSLGYAPNGLSALWRDGADGGHRDELVHFRLGRADWLADPEAAAVTIEGVEPTLPFFGLA